MTPEKKSIIHAIALDAEKLAEEIDGYELENQDGINALDAHIRQCWTLRQISFFSSYLHGGRFISDAGWVRNSSGIVMQTHEEDEVLARLFDTLRDTSNVLIGAASVLNMQDARLVGGWAFADEGEGPTLYDFTLNELMGKVPVGLRERLDKAIRPISQARDNARNRQGGLDRRNKELEKENEKLRKELDAVRLAYLQTMGKGAT